MSKSKRRWQARQGDVHIERIEKLPKLGEEIARERGAVVLAHGEATGHAHQIRAPGVCQLRAEGIHGHAVLRVSEEIVDMVHEEHGAIPIAPGNYEVTRQCEWDWEMERANNVAD
jgi:hypothetical protein